MSDIPVFQKNVAVLNAVAMTANRTSSLFDGSEARVFGARISWTGTSPVGTVNLRASLDGTNWDTIASHIVAANLGSVLINLGPLPYPYLQAAYDFISGTGTLTVQICSKQ